MAPDPSAPWQSMQLYETKRAAPSLILVRSPSKGLASWLKPPRSARPGWMCSGCCMRVGCTPDVACGVDCGCWAARLTMAGSRASAASPLGTQPADATNARAATTRIHDRITSPSSLICTWPVIELKREHEQHSSPRRILCKIRQCSTAFPHVEGEVCRDVAGDEQTHIAADAGVDSHVLLAVRTGVRDRIADDARADAELPEHFTGAGVRRLEPSIERAIKHDVTRGHEGAAPHGKWLVDPPYLAAVRRIPGHELALVVARSACLRHVRADVRRTGDVAHRTALEIHAEVVRGYVEQSCLRRDRGRLVMLATLGRA